MLKIGLAQIAPIWLDKNATIEKVLKYIEQGAEKNCDLIVFGEGLLPGYPFWLSITHGAEFDSAMQKEIHAHYVQQSVQIEKGDLDSICQAAKRLKVAIYIGTIERGQNRGNHSIYCSLVYIDKKGIIQSVHRKLQPTYEERLTWAPGDGHGLRVHELEEFTIGGLNCWENWMPLSRTALYGMGENLHIAVWPGSKRNTEDITRYIAKESRSFVVSVSGYMTKEDIPKNTPYYEEIVSKAPDILANGGSCVSAPNGEWLIEPVTNTEKLITADLDISKVLEERQNFDPTGHYSRPDITKLIVNRERQSVVEIEENQANNQK